MARLARKVAAVLTSRAAWCRIQAAQTAHQFSSALWACDKLQLKDGPMLPQLLSGGTELLMRRPDTWQMRQLSACMVGLAHLQAEGDAAFLSAAEQQLLRLLPTAEASSHC